MPIELTPSTTVRVAPPVVPALRMAPPVSPTVVVLPVAGAPGPAGPPGPSGSGSPVVHTQSTPAASWSVSHAFGRIPHAMVLDTAGRRMLADLDFPDAATVVVTHAVPLAGSLHLI